MPLYPSDLLYPSDVLWPEEESWTPHAVGPPRYGLTPGVGRWPGTQGALFAGGGRGMLDLYGLTSSPGLLKVAFTIAYASRALDLEYGDGKLDLDFSSPVKDVTLS